MNKHEVRTYTLKGEVDISNIQSQMKKLKQSLEGSLEPKALTSFDKIYSKLEKSLLAYQQSLSRSFFNKSDVSSAQKSILNLNNAVSDFNVSITQLLSRSENIKFSEGFSQYFEQESKRIKDLQKEIEDSTKNWSLRLNNAIKGQNISTNNKNILKNSIGDAEEFKKQLDKIVDEEIEATKKAKEKLESKIKEKESAKSIADKQVEDKSLVNLSATERKILQSSQNKMDKLTPKISKLDERRQAIIDKQKKFDDDIKQLKQYEKTINSAAKALRELKKQKEQDANSVSDKTLNNAQKAYDKALEDRRKFKVDKFGNTKFGADKIKENNKENEEKQNQSLKEIEKELIPLQAEFEAANKAYEDLIEKSQTELKEKAAKLKDELDELKQQLEESSSKLESLTSGKENIENIYNNKPNNEEKQQEIDTLKENLEKRTKEEVEAIKTDTDYKNLQEDIKDSVEERTKIGGEGLKVINEEMTATEKLNSSLDKVKNYIKNIVSIGTAFQGIKRAISQTFNDIKELDKAFSSIAMVTSYSVQDMWNSYDQYAQMANKLGQSTKDVIASSALFYQQGGLRTIF